MTTDNKDLNKDSKLRAVDQLLSSLGLSKKKVKVLDMEMEKGKSSIISLDLSNCDISILPEGAFLDFPPIMSLDLSNNKIKSLPENIFRATCFRMLFQLKLNNNHIEFLPDEIFPKDTFQNLDILDLSNNNLEHSEDQFLPRSMINLGHLSSINLNGNPLDDHIAKLHKFDKLERLGTKSRKNKNPVEKLMQFLEENHPVLIEEQKIKRNEQRKAAQEFELQKEAKLNEQMKKSQQERKEKTIHAINRCKKAIGNVIPLKDVAEDIVTFGPLESPVPVTERDLKRLIFDLIEEDLIDASIKNNELVFATSSSTGKTEGQAINNLYQICDRFSEVVRELIDYRYGKNKRTTISMNDEYDTQDLFRALLHLFFDEVIPEEYSPSYAGGKSRIDFNLPNEKIIIEIKFATDKLRDKEIGEELVIDNTRYKGKEGWESLFCFVYDPNKKIRNANTLKRQLEDAHEKMIVVISN